MALHDPYRCEQLGAAHTHHAAAARPRTQQVVHAQIKGQLESLAMHIVRAIGVQTRDEGEIGGKVAVRHGHAFRFAGAA